MTATAFTFAGQFDNTTTASILEVPLSSLPQEILPSKQGFYYVRFAAAESDFAHAGSVLPGLGIGYRRFTGSGAADISISGIGHAERKGGRILWTAPKASFIHYFQPDAKKSAYVGGGLAWGGIDSRKQRYIGLIPSVVAGYEFIRKSVVLSFLELTLSQPALSVYRTEEFPGPIVEFSTGIGF
jgi:hypothetical protein